MKFNLVLFDLDGTISKSAKGIINCVQYALESIGIHEENMDILKTFIGPPLTEQFQKVYGLDEKTSIQLLEKYRERYNPIGLYETSLYEGMEDLLKVGKEKGMIFGIVSSKPQVYLNRVLEHLGVLSYFQEVVGPSLSHKEVDSKAKMIASVLEKYPNASACMIGDRKFDIRGAKKNQIFSIAVSYGYGSIEELVKENPDYIAESVNDLQIFLTEENVHDKKHI